MAKRKKADKQERNTASKRTEAMGFPIVGIGASAGGLEALEELLDQLPSDTGIAFVIVTHQHPGHVSLLPELLGRDTAMPVTEARSGTKLQPNHIYVCPPGGNLAILNGSLHEMDADDGSAPKRPIDFFFRSLAADQKEHAICIVLSGTGTDGTLGLEAIKAESGMAMAQQPHSAKHAGMPSSAIGTGLVDYVSPPGEMPGPLVAYVNSPCWKDAIRGIEPAEGNQLVGLPPEVMQKMFLLLRSHTGHDFSAYKENTVRRRIQRRMNVHQISYANDYVRFLQDNAHEIDLLFNELLISVTSFFRDPESWHALASGPLATLLRSRPDNYPVRAWVPGCATGEEVYTLAITLHECMVDLERDFDVHIFGTDLDHQAVDVARVGQYVNGIGDDLSPERLEKYFTRINGMYEICREIRAMAVFATQNVIKDSPFTKLDILVCRNVLIYLNSDLQKRLLPIFHYALNPGGLLMLGPSETIGDFTDLFVPVEKKWKIYRRTETLAKFHAVSDLPAKIRTIGESTEAIKRTSALRGSHITSLVERVAMARFCPAFVVVNDRGDIVHVHGRTGEFLELAEGQAGTNVLDMARVGLPFELASLMRQVATEHKEAVRERIRVRTNGGYAFVQVSVIPIHNPEPIRGLRMITFRSTGKTEPLESVVNVKPRTADAHAPTDLPVVTEFDRAATLERELQYVKETHQTTLEELETAIEELKSANEELQSTNEEMQSTNEELETSKEEMQSLNEELTTVNTELQSMVDDLSQANDDMQNLLNSTDIATIFLDDSLNIMRYTEEAAKIVALRTSDVGRPIGDLTSKLKYGGLVDDCTKVLDTLVPEKKEIESTDGVCYLMRILPYRTTDEVIDGLVLTYVNIQELKDAQESGELRAFFEAIVDTVRQPLLVLDDALQIVSANRIFFDTFKLRQTQVLGKPLAKLGKDWEAAELRELLEEILPGNTTFDSFRFQCDSPNDGKRSYLLNARRLNHGASLPGRILLAIEDVTERQAK